MNTRFTKSIDTIHVEIFNESGCDYVEVSQTNLRGPSKANIFLKGDREGALIFLRKIADLIGVNI